MMNKLINSIAYAIRNVWGDGYTIYSESMGQDYQKPCFAIVPLAASQEQKLGQCYQVNYPFDIQYFAQGQGEVNKEIYEIAEQLAVVLEYIDLDGELLRGIDVHYKKEEGILHFFVSYRFHIIRQKEQEPHMTDLSVQMAVKEE